MAWKSLLRHLEEPLPETFKNYSDELRSEEPMLFWYPCSGDDLTPLVLDTPPGSDGYRIFPLRGVAGSLVLWMNDLRDDLTSVYELLAEQSELSATLKDSQERFRATVTQVAGGCHRTRIRVCQEFASDPEHIPIEFCLGRAENHRYTGKRKRPERGDVYLFIYCHVDTRYLFRQVFRSMGFRIKVGAIIHPGWAERTDGPTDHYQIVPQVLAFMRAKYRIAPVLLTDNRKPTWGSDFFEDQNSTVTWTSVDINKYTLNNPIPVLPLDSRDPRSPRWVNETTV